MRPVGSGDEACDAVGLKPVAMTYDADRGLDRDTGVDGLLDRVVDGARDFAVREVWAVHVGYALLE